MRIVVMGSGGVGGYFGAKLAKAGQQVTFVARGAHLQAMRQTGLRIRSAIDGDWRVQAEAVDRLDGQPAADLVLLCVKSFDTEAAANHIRPVIGPGTAVLSLQNGIDNEDKIGRLLGAAHVLGGVAYVFAGIAAPGVVAHHQLGRIVFGEMDGTVSARVDAIARAFTDAGIEAQIESSIRRTLWQKYVFLTALAGTTSVTRLPAGVIRDVPESRALWQLQVSELLTLAAAEGVDLGTGAMDACVKFLDSLAPTNTSSLYQDLSLGRKLELEALHGHAVALGRRHGVPVPTLFAVYAALKPFLCGGQPELPPQA